MRIEKVTVGSKIGTEVVKVECAVRVPDTTEDMLELARQSLPFVVKMFTRGWRIWNQEQSGARDFVAASTVEQRKDGTAFAKSVQEIIDTADPTAPAKRTGRPAKAPELTVNAEIQKAMKKGDMNALAALLAAQGVKLNIAK